MSRSSRHSGDHDVCRNLVRLAVSVCDAWLQCSLDVSGLQQEQGILALLIKGGAHPSVNVSCLALDKLCALVERMPAIGVELLPMVQRRAIIPHHSVSGAISLSASDLCGVNFHDYETFRETTLTSAAVACFKTAGDTFMDSCASAVEEFCASNSTVDVSLHLEAAIFCLDAVGEEALGAKKDFRYARQLQRCTKAFSNRPRSLIENPLTLARMCAFIRTVRTMLP